MGTRIRDDLFIVSSPRIIASESDCPYTCGRMDKTILSAKAVGYERDIQSLTGPSEYLTIRVGRFDDDPDLVITRIDKIADASLRARREAQASNDSREYLQATPYLDAPTRHEVYSMENDTLLQRDRKVTTGCVMYTYLNPHLVPNIESIRFTRLDVEHIGTVPLGWHYKLPDFSNRFVHLFTFNPPKSGRITDLNEGSPIFCQEKLSFITSLRMRNFTLRAISIADNYANLDNLKTTIRKSFRFPKPPPE